MFSPLKISTLRIIFFYIFHLPTKPYLMYSNIKQDIHLSLAARRHIVGFFFSFSFISQGSNSIMIIKNDPGHRPHPRPRRGFQIRPATLSKHVPRRDGESFSSRQFERRICRVLLPLCPSAWHGAGCTFAIRVRLFLFFL